MDNKQSVVQTILLIDTFRHECLSDNQSLQKFRALVLTSFRILCSLQSFQESKSDGKQKPNKETGLKWSFKFFNSRSYKSSAKQVNLRDFKLRYFEQFEAKLKETLQETVAEKSGTKTKVTAAECLQKALTEVVTDIQWQMPDTASPMKGRRYSKQTQQQSQNHNIVFLFSDLPTNSQQMRMFAGKRVLDSDIFLDAIMPPHLFEQFCHHAKLSLYWIDITSLNGSCYEKPGCHQHQVDTNSIEIITKSLSHVKGTALTVDSLVNLGSTYGNDSKVGVKSRQRRVSAEGLPSGETSDSQTKDSADHDRTKKACVSVHKSLASFFSSYSVIQGLADRQRQCELSGSGSHAACLQLTVEDKTENINLSLEPVSESKKSNVFSSPQNTHPRTQEFVAEPHQQLVKVHLSKEDAPLTTLTVLSDSVLLPKNLQLAVHSCIPKCMYSTQSTAGAAGFWASVCGQGETTSSANADMMFQDLLQGLAQKDSLLVLTVKTSGYASPLLALLDAVSPHTAVLTLLPLGATLQVEKARLSQSEKCSSPPDVVQTESRLSNLHSALKKECQSVKGKILARKPHRKCRQSGRQPVDTPGCYNPQVTNPWHLPGTSKGLPTLINKLNNRLKDLDFLTSAEKETLKALQKMYRKDNQPQALIQRSRQQPDTTQTGKAGDQDDETVDRQEGKTRNSKLNRGMMMVCRSKAAVKKNTKTEEDSSQADKQTERHNINITSLELQTEESVGQYLRDLYNRTLDIEDGLESCVQMMVTVAVHFMKEKHADNPEVQAVELVQREVGMSSAALREKYQSKASDTDKTMKITEYKLQTLLLLEIESAVLSAEDSHIEKCVDEVVNLLRTLSFITDPGFVPKFLNDVIVTSYSATLPRLLVSVYDELMQPLPDSLAMFASPNKSADSSVLNESLQSHDSIAEPGSQPDVLQSQASRNLRNRKLQHPSLSDYGNRKQIMVHKKPANAKPKEEKIKRQKSVQPTTKTKKNKGKSEMVKVRRNLFEGDQPKLERRQSVAVMERTRKSPRKKVTTTTFRSPKASKSPGVKRRSVAETPAHKQRSNAVWNRLDNKRKRTHTEEEVEVVMESPMKQCEDNFKKVSPSRNKHAVNMMRRSFYSAGPRNRSRNLTKYFQFADKIAGRQQRASLGDVSKCGSEPRPQTSFKSPSRSSFLMSQLMGSPSPRHKTPSKPHTATTPKHMVQESPFRGKRSKTPKKFSKVLLFDSPKRPSVPVREQESSDILTSPSKHHRTPKKQGQVNVLCAASPYQNTRSQTPSRSRGSTHDHNTNVFPISADNIPIPSTPKQTPHRHTSTPSLLSPPPGPPLTPQRSILKSSQSAAKRILDLPSTPQRTPKLSQGQVPESPSQNTRSKGSTPSRTSVCTALFMKSPQGRVTPRTKLFSNVRAPSDIGSPSRRVHFDDDGCDVENSKQRGADAVVTHGQTKMSDKSTTQISFLNMDGSVTSLNLEVPSVTSPPSKSEQVQRTPSPQKQLKVKTPDSFDKWPRRKRRWASPTQPPCQKENLHAGSSPAKEDKGNTVSGSEHTAEHNVNVSRKRSFVESIQDSSTTYSPCKRSKTSWSETVSFKDSKETRYCLHRRVSSLASVNEHLPSENNSSLVSSGMDYFSATNDDVFLPNDSEEMHSVALDSSGQTSGQSHPHSLRNRGQVQSFPRSESPIFGSSPSISRLLQDQHTISSTSSQGFDVNTEEEEEQLPSSPKFQTSPALTNKPSKTTSPQTSTACVSPVRQSSRTNRSTPSPNSRSPSSVQKSPFPRTSSVAESPRQRKFSPSVSARSLVLLMNSPIIKADGNQIKSPQEKRHSSHHPHLKSRKSLNLHK
ncbi:treslin-like [Haliotis asinina]|uniref:treslin-like n=1 Tax=Haliotis asinina TaxID=109174 RepID=UPI0035323296